ncbi:MAG: STAS domain-containing protein [Leptospiraceae bacterium]|nr:STAS domain-containing protein [Leptospiraceae bacterium]
MTYSHKVVGGIDIVNIEDSMDLYSVPELKKFCKNLTRNENAKIIFVLKKVHFMDSSGLGMLTNLFFECQQKGIPLKFAELSAEAKRMFVLTKLDKSFKLYDTVEDAISEFQ